MEVFKVHWLLLAHNVRIWRCVWVFWPKRRRRIRNSYESVNDCGLGAHNSADPDSNFV